MKIFPLRSRPVALRCPNLDGPGVLGFTVFLGKLRMRCMVADVLLRSTERRLGCTRTEAGREEALAICVPQLVANLRQADRLAELPFP
jgi:hypothetical protein